MRLERETPDERGRLPRERFYGRRKMRALVVRKGLVVCESRIGRLMGQTGMKGLVNGRQVVTTRKTKPTSEDLVNRKFTAVAPNRLWVTDLTYVRTVAGWVYVSFITDAYSRKIVAAHGACQMRRVLVS
jgi:putative transposase